MTDQLTTMTEPELEFKDPIDVDEILYALKHVGNNICLPSRGQVWAIKTTESPDLNYRWVKEVYVKHDERRGVPSSLGRLMIELWPVRMANDGGWVTDWGDRKITYKRWDHFLLDAINLSSAPTPRILIARNVEPVRQDTGAVMHL